MLADESFIRWIKGSAGYRESRQWEKWLEQDEAHHELRNRARLFYRLPLQVSEGADVEQQLRRLEAGMDRRHRQQHADRDRRYKKKYYWIAAAVALLLATVGILASYRTQHPGQDKTPLYTSIEVGYGEKGMLKISDGSVVRLNAHSTLRYSPEQFNRSKVEVWLKGEAYFSITRNPQGRKRRFVVHTPDGDVRVLGTRFNVNTRFHRTWVVLEKGSVEAVLKDSLHQIIGQGLLRPGQIAQLSSGKESIHIHRVDTTLYTAWVDGKLVFDKTPLKEIIPTIEATYGVEVTCEDPRLLEEKVSGSLQNPDLQTLVKGLEKSLKINIRQQDKGKTLIIRRH